MAAAVHPDKINMTNILTPLHIGRQRDKPNRRPHDPARRRWPKWPKLRQTTPKADDNANAHEGEDVENVTPASGVGESGADETRTESGEGEMEGRRGGDGGEGGDDHDDDHDHDHATDHNDFTCQPTSSQHNAYIRANLEMLQKKCSEFHACTQEVYRAENFHRILAGGNIQLSNMCGLMYANGGGRYTSLDKQCTKTERNAIRQDIGSRLSGKLADPPQDATKPAWKRLNRCLQHNLKKDEQLIDTACRLKKNSDFLCEDHGIDSVTEDFFNHEMEHLHCSCKAIKAEAANANAASSSGLPVPVRLAIGGGICGLLIILIIVVVVLCVRHRRMKRELKKHRMQYLPSPHGEPSAIYQEIGDHSQAMEALRRARDQGSLPATYQFMDQAPALPDRYVKDISRSRTNLADPTAPGDVEYLEPIPDPKRRQLEAHSNDAYNASQCSQRSGENNVYHLAKHPGTTPPTQRRQAENDTYFDRINLRRVGNNPEEDGGYSSLSRKYAAKSELADRGNVSPEETEPLNRPEGEGGGEEPKYFVLETNTSEKEALADAGSKTSV